MAARKKKTTSAIVPLDKGISPALQKEFAGYITQQQASTPAGSGMPTISASNGLFTFPGSDTGVETFQAVALCALRANQWWEGAFTPGEASPPDCSAIAKLGEHENTMAPFESCQKPQSTSCVSCPQNIAPGKKCRNGLHVALIHVDQIGDEGATIGRLRLSSTAIQPFAQVARFLAEKGLPLFGAVLQFHQEQPEGATYWSTRATPVGAVADPSALAARVDEAAKLLIAGAAPSPVIDTNSSEAAPTKTPAKKPARRKATRKKGARRKL